MTKNWKNSRIIYNIQQVLTLVYGSSLSIVAGKCAYGPAYQILINLQPVKDLNRFLGGGGMKDQHRSIELPLGLMWYRQYKIWIPFFRLWIGTSEPEQLALSPGQIINHEKHTFQ